MKNAHLETVAKEHNKAKFWKFNQGFANTFKLTCTEKPKFCVSHALAKEIFHKIVKSNATEMTKAELMKAVEYAAHYEHRELSKENLEYIHRVMNDDAAKGGNKNTLTEQEFWVFVNQYTHYFRVPCPSE